MRTFIVSLLVVFCVGSGVAGPWIATSVKSKSRLHGVILPSATLGYAVGEKGTLLKTTDAGVTWNQQAFSGSNLSLFGVAANDSTVVFATADNGSVIYNFTGKGQWSNSPPLPVSLFATSPQRITRDTAYWDAMYFNHSWEYNTYWAAGSDGNLVQLQFVHHKSVYYYPDYYPSTDTSYVEINQYQTQATSNLHGIVLQQKYIAVGDNGTVIVSSNKGTTWNSQTLDASVALKAIASMSATSFAAVGDSGNIWLSQNSGTSWSKVNIPGLVENLNGVYFVGPDTGVVVGNNGLILQTIDGGYTWTRQAVNTFQNLYGVHGYAGDVATQWVVVGDSGTIVTSSLGNTSVTFAVDPKSLDFSGVPLGSKRTDTLTFKNAASDGYLMVRMQGSDPTITVTPRELLVTPYQSGTIKVTFAPADTNRKNVTFLMMHDASWIPDTLHVSAQGVEAVELLSTKVLGFGVADAVKHQPLTITNPGNAALMISEIVFSDTAQFGARVSLPLFVPAHGSQEITVDLKKASTIDVNGTMIIKSNAIGGNDTVSLAARGFQFEGVSDAASSPSTCTVSVAPNPLTVGSQATIHVAGISVGEFSLRVFNELGEVVELAASHVNGTVDVPLHSATWPSGMYFFELAGTSGMKLGQGKFVILP